MQSKVETGLKLIVVKLHINHVSHHTHKILPTLHDNHDRIPSPVHCTALLSPLWCVEWCVVIILALQSNPQTNVHFAIVSEKRADDVHI